MKVYGSGLLSSHSEIAHAIEAPEVQRYPIQLEWAINQGFEINHYQPLLFIVDSFDHLFSLVDQLETWMKDGKLANVAPGVKPGGKLIFSVCTLARAETTEVVEHFNAIRPEFEPLAWPEISGSQRPFTPAAAKIIWPQDLDGNGMFIAGWRRKKV